MAETISSIIDEAMEPFTPIDQQRLIEAGVHNAVISALNTDCREAVTLPGEGDLTILDLSRRVENENIGRIRALAAREVGAIADRLRLN